MPSPRLRRSALALAAAALAGALAGPAQAQSAPSPSPSPSPSGSASPSPAGGPEPADACLSQSGESPVRVEVTTLLPRAPQRPDEPFQVAGRLTNCGPDELRALQVRLAVGSRIGTRSELRLAADEPTVGGRRLPPAAPADDVLAPGASTSFDLRLLVGDLQLGRGNGAYPLAVQVRGRPDDQRFRRTLGLASTFVPWFPEGPPAPTRLAWVVPLVDRPRSAPSGELLGEDLQALLEDDPAAPGRLQRALLTGREGSRGACEPAARPPDGAAAPPAAPAPCRGEAVPMTWAVDPDLLVSVDAMTRPYDVLVGGSPQQRPASPEAQQWLTALRATAAEGQVLALPYGDPDVVALSRTASGLKDDVGQLRRLGESEARRLLGQPPLDTVAWPPPGPVIPVVDALAADERTALLLDESALPPAGERTDRTPSARTTLPSQFAPVTALVADAALSGLVEPDPTAAQWQGARLAEQRWIAETAVLAAERPGESRTLVVAPRRRADLLPEVAAQAVADTGRLPWLCPVSLAAVAAGTERCARQPDAQGPAEPEDRGTPRPKSPDDVELSERFIAELAAVRRDADQLTEQVLVAGTDQAAETKARLLRARGRTASSAWRDSPAGGRRMLDLLQREVAGLRSRVSLRSSPVLLTGRTGTITLTVVNNLDQAVNVGVALDETSAARLSSQDAELQVVPGREARQVSVKVEARTSGRFTARAGLVDAGGRPFGQQVDLDVRSTEYGRVALAVTGVAFAVLLVAVGVRITRRALRRTAPATAGPPSPAEPGSGV